MIALKIGTCVLLFAVAFPLQNLASRQQESVTPEPKLPVIDFHACGSDRSGVPIEAMAQERVYSSWQPERVSVGILQPGEESTLIGGVNIIHEPDRAVVKNKLSQASFLKPGDTVLGYGYDADGTTAFWSHGVWFKEDDEHVSQTGYECGFADKTQCTIEITQPGVKDWWVQVETSGDLKGWVLGATFDGDKASYTGILDQMCRD